MNLCDLDPATLQPSMELDALIAEKWMGWNGCTLKPGYMTLFLTDTCFAVSHDESHVYGPDCLRWSPSTNPAHAGEAMRRATYFRMATGSAGHISVWLYIRQHEGSGAVNVSDTGGNRGTATALATCRAIVAALQAAESKGGE